MISCICPTTPARAWCLPLAIRAFLRQEDLPAGAELVLGVSGGELPAGLVPDDPRIRVLQIPEVATLGDKHNVLVAAARNDLVAKWDDDDYHAPWRLARSYQRMRARRAHVVGTRNLFIYDLHASRLWLYRHDAVVHEIEPGGRTGGWVSGNALLFHRSVWKANPFPSLTCGVDTLWIRDVNISGWTIDYVPDEVVVVMEWGQGTGRKQWRPAPPTHLQLDRGELEMPPAEFLAMFRLAYERRARVG